LRKIKQKFMKNWWWKKISKITTLLNYDEKKL
jgi:hypothetical protein